MTVSPITEIKTPEPLRSRFEQLGVSVTTWAHKPVFTVDDGEDVKAALEGGQTKNLFLRDKRGGIWLVTALAETQINLRELSDRLGCARFSFGSPELLGEILGVKPGSVTPFALINDRERKVQVVFDQAMMPHKVLNFHPLENTMTTAIAPDGLLKFAASCGHRPIMIDFSVREQKHGS